MTSLWTRRAIHLAALSFLTANLGVSAMASEINTKAPVTLINSFEVPEDRLADAVARAFGRGLAALGQPPRCPQQAERQEHRADSDEAYDHDHPQHPHGLAGAWRWGRGRRCRAAARCAGRAAIAALLESGAFTTLSIPENTAEGA